MQIQISKLGDNHHLRDTSNMSLLALSLLSTLLFAILLRFIINNNYYYSFLLHFYSHCYFYFLKKIYGSIGTIISNNEVMGT